MYTIASNGPFFLILYVQRIYLIIQKYKQGTVWYLKLTKITNCDGTYLLKILLNNCKTSF